MTDSVQTPATPPAWYPDPADATRLRWWDGGQWTAHLHDPSLAQQPVVSTPTVGPQTPVYNGFIWAIVLLPLLSSIAFLTFDMNGYAIRSLSGERGVSLATVPYSLIGWAIYLVIPLLAYFDRRRLQRDGYVRPFHWAWAFLNSAVYVIGRSVVVKRRSGRGIAPIWIWAAVVLVSIAIAVIKTAGAVATIVSTVPVTSS
ncbi:MAG: hypothetical protein QOD05_1702 [Microbacteriaceae bacterium]|nr:hypothetical protein [Microbacteriaceae bacterium]